MAKRRGTGNWLDRRTSKNAGANLSTSQLHAFHQAKPAATDDGAADFKTAMLSGRALCLDAAAAGPISKSSQDDYTQP